MLNRTPTKGRSATRLITAPTMSIILGSILLATAWLSWRVGHSQGAHLHVGRGLFTTDLELALTFANAREAHVTQRPGSAVALKYVYTMQNPFWMALPVGMHTAAFRVHEEIIQKGAWAPSETAGFLEVMQRYCSSPQNLVVDAGSNVGWYCALAVASGCRCIAFDGNLEALQYLQMTKQLNGWSEQQMHIVPSLLSNDEQITYDGWNVFQIADKKKARGPTSVSAWVTTTTAQLDTMVTEQPVFLKVDVEGWEPSVFATAKEMFAKRPPKYVFFEAAFFLKRSAQEWNTGYIDVMIMLHQAGYMCAELHENSAGPMARKARVPHLNNLAAASSWFDSLKIHCNTSAVMACGFEYVCASKEARMDGLVPSYERLLS